MLHDSKKSSVPSWCSFTLRFAKYADKKINSCCFCYEKSLEARSNILICKSCIQAFADQYRWVGCSRCGQKQQHFSCHHLKEFSSCTSLLAFKAPLSDEFVRAKYEKTFIAEIFFEECFREWIVSSLKTEIQKHQISLLICSPVRFIRFFSLKWHPLFSLLPFLKKNFPTVDIVCPYKWSISAHSQQSSQERHRQVKHASIRRQRLLFSPQEKKLLFNDHKNILFFDDVLTSGLSALKTRISCPEELQRVNWHLFTLFRAPQ